MALPSEHARLDALLDFLVAVMVRELADDGGAESAGAGEGAKPREAPTVASKPDRVPRNRSRSEAA
jgi:hypothetical protein